MGAALLCGVEIETTWAQDPAPKADAAAPAAAPAPAPADPGPSATPTKADSTGASYAGVGVSTTAALTKDGDKVTPDTLAKDVKLLKIGLNMAWTLLCGFLIMFMQAGFALVEAGLTRHKNAGHTMAMNFIVYGIGMLSFWAVGFGLMAGGWGSILAFDGPNVLDKMFTIELGGKPFDLFGYKGFFLAGDANDSSVLVLFLFQMVFMDTTATIPTGALAERWKFISFCLFSILLCAFIYPIYGCWVWGGGWLSDLGANFGLGNGHIDFAGSSVVHMTGGVSALATAILLGPRVGKFNKDGSANAIPGHNIPMVVLGTLILAFGWFGFNTGSTVAATDLRMASVAVCTMLATAAGCISSMIYMWTVFGKPDPTMACNGLLAGAVAITAPCAFVDPVASVIIGAIAGILVIWSVFFVERVLKVDDPVGAVSVHGVCGAFGCLAIGLFANGQYGGGLNGVSSAPLGLFYGGGINQLIAQTIGVLANIAWVFPTAFVSFWFVGKLVGNRVPVKDEINGLDIPEMGVLGYVNEDPIEVKNAGLNLLHGEA
jgi:Amt family ammonium transporter